MILRLLLNCLSLLFLPLSALRWRRAAPRGAYVVLEIDGGVVDLVPPRRPLARLFWRAAPPSLPVERVREMARRMQDDDRVAGLLLRIRSVHGGSAAIASLRDVLGELRAAGKDIIAYLPMGADNLGMLLASSARVILVGPGTQLSPLGYAAEGLYLRRALELAGVEPEVLARGDYKSAGESLVRDSMSDAQREQVGALLDARHGDLCAALAEARNVDRETAARWIDGAPHGAADAVKMGLADAVAYEDELERAIADRVPSGSPPPLVPAGRYDRARRALRFRPVLPRPVIGVIEVHGPIVSRVRMRGSALSSLSGAAASLSGAAGPVPMPVASEEHLVASLRAARQDGRVRGVVLHIDSPGGSALASDRIHHEVIRLAEVKPVVAYLSNVAASGGYYIAAGAQAIVAQPQSITGSIGVVAARIAIGPLLARLGVSIEIEKRGARADMFTAVRKLEPGERAALERELDAVYRTFLDVVARGRRRSVEEIEPLAGGRVYTGAEAHARGLVDKLGGFDLALRELRDRLGPPAARLEPVIVRVGRYVPPPPHLPTPVPAALAALGALGVHGLAPAAELLTLALHTDGERTLAWWPGDLS